MSNLFDEVKSIMPTSTKKREVKHKVYVSEEYDKLASGIKLAALQGFTSLHTSDIGISDLIHQENRYKVVNEGFEVDFVLVNANTIISWKHWDKKEPSEEG